MRNTLIISRTTILTIMALPKVLGNFLISTRKFGIYDEEYNSERYEKGIPCPLFK
jgi:hypothetical protein